MERDYSNEELMAVLISREVRDGEIAASGALSMIPAAGLLLARELHAPNVEIMILGSPAFMPFKTSRQFHFLAHRGELGLFFVSGVQIDGHGNYNLHMVGEDQDHPKVRFPGGYGGGMLYYAARRSIIFRTEHSRRAFVEKVDFISAAGTSPPDTLRYGNPCKVITPLATMHMDLQEGLLKLESYNPPVTVAEVVENTGFDLGDVSSVQAAPAPTEEELGLLRDAVRRKMIETDTYPDWARSHLGNLRIA
ncbi:MAG: CoA synthetase [SAR324 cluster bacterium]|nr:CoA synthetase [SAR324 cluster bacterium]